MQSPAGASVSMGKISAVDGLERYSLKHLLRHKNKHKNEFLACD